MEVMSWEATDVRMRFSVSCPDDETDRVHRMPDSTCCTHEFLLRIEQTHQHRFDRCDPCPLHSIHPQARLVLTKRVHEFRAQTAFDPTSLDAPCQDARTEQSDHDLSCLYFDEYEQYE